MYDSHGVMRMLHQLSVDAVHIISRGGGAHYYSANVVTF